MRSLGEINRSLEINQRAKEFAQLALFIMLGGTLSDAARLADASNQTPERVRSILKALVPGGSLSDPTWAGNLSDYPTLVGGFIASLAQSSAFDRMLNGGMLRVPLKTRVAIITSAASASIVAEGAPAPVTRLDISATDALAPTRAVALVALSEESLRLSTAGAADLLAGELRKAISLATDVEFISGLANGLTPLTSSGASSANFLTDLRTLLAAVSTSASSRLYLLVTPLIAKQLAAKSTNDGELAFPSIGVNGGEIGGVQIVVTDGLPSGSNGQTIMLVDATQISGETETVTMSVAMHAAVQMDDAPDGVATNVVSLWQSNMRGLKAERWFAFWRTRDSAVAVMEGADYSDASGS